MSAVLQSPAAVVAMTDADLDEVMRIEREVYTHPWTAGNFADSLRAGYQCATLRVRGVLAGYFVLLVAAGEAHLLNLSVDAGHQGRGYGKALLEEVVGRCARLGARSVFLEVRPSNRVAQALYESRGFRRIAVRRGYYPAHGGREDALVYLREL